jgi:hypothetical protein
MQGEQCDRSELLDQLRKVAEGLAGGGGAVIIVVPGTPGNVPRAGPPDEPREGFRQDLMIGQYIERFDPHISESRVAEWCRDGEFPDTVDARGNLVPGAYRHGRPWRITMEGIEERQRRARAVGLAGRGPVHAAPDVAGAGDVQEEAVAKGLAGGAQSVSPGAAIPASPPPCRRAAAAAPSAPPPRAGGRRTNQDAWLQVKGRGGEAA